ncbi:MAG: adenylosuccinate synthetase, partial [Pseudomonadota bacterium]
ERLREVMDYHNFVLEHFFKDSPLEVPAVLEEALAQAEWLRPLAVDVPGELYQLRRAGKNVLFEGAQGSLLDIDHGTYPFVTSSNTTAGGAAAGSGVGPMFFDGVLGIVKAYTTRVGGGPFPTELFDADGDHLGRRGHEFGATTGRKRRCGWLDIVALRRAMQINSITSLCITKLDVLDGLERISLCVGYRLDDQEINNPPVGAERLTRCQPIYDEMPGWPQSCAGVTDYAALPPNARHYLERIEVLLGVPIDIISTGPDRAQTLMRRHPFD